MVSIKLSLLRDPLRWALGTHWQWALTLPPPPIHRLNHLIKCPTSFHHPKQYKVDPVVPSIWNFGWMPDQGLVIMRRVPILWFTRMDHQANPTKYLCMISSPYCGNWCSHDIFFFPTGKQQLVIFYRFLKQHHIA